MAPSIDKVLIAVGPNDREHVERLVDEAIAVAAPTDATVYLLHVFSRDEYDDLLGEMDIEPRSGALGPDELAARHEGIKTPADRLEEADIDYEVRGIVGTPESEIVRFAEEIAADRLIIGAAGRSPTGKAVFGDHAQQVLLNAPCPVTYIKRE